MTNKKGIKLKIFASINFKKNVLNIAAIFVRAHGSKAIRGYGEICFKFVILSGLVRQCPKRGLNITARCMRSFAGVMNSITGECQNLFINGLPGGLINGFRINEMVALDAVGEVELECHVTKSVLKSNE